MSGKKHKAHLSEEDQERLLTAWHEAGHALMVIAGGFTLDEVSIVPIVREDGTRSLGRVVHGSGPVPTEDDCSPRSTWLEAHLRIAVAGDRAGRLVGCGETSLGAQHNDYPHAESLIAATSGVAAIESELDRICREVDALFAEGGLRTDLQVLADALLLAEQMSGSDVRELVAHGECGCVHPEDVTIRCDLPPHARGNHMRLPPPERRSSDDAIIWEGYTTKKPRRSGTARWRRIVRLTHPGWLPETDRELSPEDFREYLDMKSDGRFSRLAKAEQAKLNRRIQSYLSKRLIPETRVGPPTGSPIVWSREVALANHAEGCSGTLDIATDGSAWCSECALETHRMTADRPARTQNTYVVIELETLHAWDEVGGECHRVESQRIIDGFRKSEAASTFLRLARQQNRHWKVRVERLQVT